MRFAKLRGNGLTKNTIFSAESSENRDDCFLPYILLKSKLNDSGIEINTFDKTTKDVTSFEIHQDVQYESTSSLNYLLMFETKYVRNENADKKLWSKYKKIFTWDESLVDGDRFIHLNLPNQICVPRIDGFLKRDRFCCLISGNKTLLTNEAKSLYPERVSVVRWFESHAPQDFDLYGVDWNLPEARTGVTGKIIRRFWKIINRIYVLRPFPSYRGRLKHKREALIKTRFSICYENVRDVPGYITEKIFDCFFSGCVPVYWGADNITDFVPRDCFIDRRNFSNTAEIYEFLKSISEDDFLAYQQRIANFLESNAAYTFSSECFAETIVNTVVQDLGT